MQPQQTPYQPGQVFQPQQPTPPVPTYDFTQNNQPPQQPVQQPQQPQQPAFDPNQFKQEVINGVASVLQDQLPAQQPQQPDDKDIELQKKYDEWGAVFDDVGKLIDKKFDEREQQAQTTTQQLEQQEQQNQQYIDSTLNELRNAGYLPPVQNNFDANDAGKQAENELLGYAVNLGTTNLPAAAEELKKHHERGEYFDYRTNQWVNTGQPQQDSGPSMFGTLPQHADQQLPTQQQMQQSVYPQQPIQPYGPQNPYAVRPQYPAGFNAPVSNGGSYTGMGMQGQAPGVSTLRHNSYDNLVDMFNRTQ